MTSLPYYQDDYVTLYHGLHTGSDPVNGQCQPANTTSSSARWGWTSWNIWQFASTPARQGRHPCEKPTPLISHMIETSSREGDLILDPFAGSGSTLEAARNLLRRSIGIEQEERYCEQIADRLSAGPLILDEAA